MNQAELHFDDFTGFTFNGHHSSDFNLYRVSNGSRYSENLLPTFSDYTTLVDRTEETYYWNSKFTQRQIPIQVAFDNISETQFRELRQCLGTKKLSELIFDERPYKIYTAKVQQSPQFTFICFEENGERVYKGEGTINFICYYPFARSKYKYISRYQTDNTIAITDNKPMPFPTIDQWKSSTGMKNEQGNYDGTGTTINVYNPGDFDTPFILYIPIDIGANGFSINTVTLQDNGITKAVLSFSTIPSKINDTDACLAINMKTNLIEGCLSSQNNYARTGSIYNKYIKSGDFFKIPQNVITDGVVTSNYIITCGKDIEKIQYDYLYY